MAKFDSDKSEHISLLNDLCNKAAAHFGNGYVYYSDCLRDVEALQWLNNGEMRYWLVGETCTVMLTERSDAINMFETHENMNALYTIECIVTHGKRFNIQLVNLD